MYFPEANGLAFATCGPVNCKTLFQNLIKLNSVKLRLSTVDFPQSLKGMRKESFDSHLLLHFVLIQYFSVANPVLQIRRGGGVHRGVRAPRTPPLDRPLFLYSLPFRYDLYFAPVYIPMETTTSDHTSGYPGNQPAFSFVSRGT